VKSVNDDYSFGSKDTLKQASAQLKLKRSGGYSISLLMAFTTQKTRFSKKPGL
jgi:hypothetical protein